MFSSERLSELADDRSDALMLIELYVTSVRTNLDDMTTAIATGDTEGFRRACHGLKGTSDTIGAYRLSARIASARAEAEGCPSEDFVEHIRAESDLALSAMTQWAEAHAFDPS